MVMYLNVPHYEKDHARLRGVRWDPKKEKWYVPDGVSVVGFQRWWTISP